MINKILNLNILILKLKILIFACIGLSADFRATWCGQKKQIIMRKKSIFLSHNNHLIVYYICFSLIIAVFIFYHISHFISDFCKFELKPT